MSEAQRRADVRPSRPVAPGLVALAWLWVIVPFSYGLWQLLQKIPALFG